MSGTGTQSDPYVVTTYAELVEKAAESDKYIKIGNDINITDEYPNGDKPQLTLNNHIDGDGKTIANWYKTTTGYDIIVNSGGQVENLKIKNIYKTYSYEFMDFRGGNAGYHFINCDFSGVIADIFMQAVDSYGSTNNFKSCSFNISTTRSDGSGRFVSNNWSYIGMKDCYLKFKTVNDTTIFATSRDTFVDGCYIEANAPLGVYNIVKNSVCDLTTSATFTLSGNSSNALNIFNTDHAPNATAGNGFAGVSDENWLNTTYLNSIGFNAG